METITITKEEFLKVATDVSSSIVSKTSEEAQEKEVSPMMVMAELLMHTQLIRELSDRLFDKEEKTNEQTN